MLLKIKKVETKEELVELKLPAFFKDDMKGYSYMITEEKSIITVDTSYAFSAYLHVLTPKYSIIDEEIKKIVVLRPISSYVFFKSYHQALDIIEASIQKPLLK